MDWLRRRFQPAPSAPAAEAPAAARHLSAARAALHAADGREALRQIALGLEADPGYLPLYKLVSTTYALLPTGQNEWRLFQAAAERPNEPQPFLELGRHFISQSGHRTAIPLLERARALAPGDVGIARCLAEALLGEFRPGEALDRLRELDPASLDGDPEARFLLHHARLLCGETEGIAEYARAERQRIGASESQSALAERLDELSAALARREAVAEPGDSLRAWHFIQYGAALLHRSPVGGGRFALVSLTEPDLARIVARLRRLLEAVGRLPETVIALPDTDSLRVGEAVAQEVGLPLHSLPSPMANRSTRQMIEDVERERDLLARPRALIVAADSRKLEAYPAFREVAAVGDGQVGQPGQTLFALTHHWLHGAPLTPDVSGLFCQSCVFPWPTPERPVAPPAPPTRFSAPDPPPRVATSRKTDPPVPAGVPEDPASFDDALAFYRERRQLFGAVVSSAAGASPSASLCRPRFRRDSPVPDDHST